jgi:hypothetical protein
MPFFLFARCRSANDMNGFMFLFFPGGYHFVIIMIPLFIRFLRERVYLS